MKHLEVSFEERLTKSGLRRTAGRLAILKLLAEEKKPLTQEEIASKLSYYKYLNKTTIYRALEIFVEKGIVHQAFVQDRVWHYELSDHCDGEQCHPHFYCHNCRVTSCLYDVRLPLAKGIGKGYQVRHQQVRLEGLCPECSKME